jgi:disulfide bond formation protein DsbB
MEKNLIKSIKEFIEVRKGYIFFTFLIASVASLLLAYFVEFVLKHRPCELCVYQRIPFFVIILISGFALIANRCVKFSKFVILLSLLFNLVISGYHSGIEQGVFAPLKPCIHSSGSSMHNDPLDSAPSCDRPSLFVFGLSMAQWNFIWNLSLIFVFIMLAIRSKESLK